MSVFAVSFLALLVLSATPEWRPDNELVVFCDRVWRVSGLAALMLSLIPGVRRVVTQLAGFLRKP